MANLPSQHPTLSIHLSDLSLTPLISSSSSPSHLDSLTSLASSALASQTAAQRAHLGRPQRILVEYPDAGPVVLHSYLDPADADAGPGAGAGATPGPDRDPALSPKHAGGDGDSAAAAAAAAAAADDDDDDDDGAADSPAARPDEAAPMLLGVVVAGSADEVRDARRAAVRLERVGRQFQREWMAQGTEPGADGATE